MPLVEYPLPFIVDPFSGELIATVGGVGVLVSEVVPVLVVPVLEVEVMLVLEVEVVPVLEIKVVPVLEIEVVLELLMPNPARM